MVPQQLTSFAGLVLLRPFLATIDFTASLARCFRHVRTGKIYGRATMFLQLIIHLLLGYGGEPRTRPIDRKQHRRRAL